jgi:hypothetical protein
MNPINLVTPPPASVLDNPHREAGIVSQMAVAETSSIEAERRHTMEMPVRSRDSRGYLSPQSRTSSSGSTSGGVWAADNTWRHLTSCNGFDLRTWLSGATPLFSSQSEGTANDTKRSFNRFLDLPPELRAKIWRICLEKPRIVVIRSLMLDPSPRVVPNELGNPASNTCWYWENRSPTPMRVCREAREEALSFFRIHLPMTTTSMERYGSWEEEKRNPVWDAIYINPEWDLILYDGTRRAMEFPVLVSDLLAYDPRGRGIGHFCSNEWPKSVWAVNPDPGFGMATLAESFANLQTFVLFTRQVAGAPGRLGEGYITAVNQQPKRPFGQNVTEVSHNPVVLRKALGRKNLPRGAADICVVDMGMRESDAYASPLYGATDGLALQLRWQAKEHEPTNMMFVTTGAIRDPRVEEGGPPGVPHVIPVGDGR